MGKLDIFKCEICGNIVQMIIPGNGELVCCGEKMKKLEPQYKEEAVMEKHVPIFIKLEDGTSEIRVGEILHPMEEQHHIMFIQAISEDKNNVQLKYLYPGEDPKLSLCNEFSTAREFCNIHGLWEGKNV